MKLLLDTHIWLWSTLQPDNLTRHIARELENDSNELWLSPVSVWELTILQRKGRFKIPGEFGAWVKRSMQELELAEAPLTMEVALSLPTIAFLHADPADHLLAASAKALDLTLVTADERLMKLPGIRVMANR